MKQWLRFLFSITFVKTALASVAILAVCVSVSLWWLNKTTLHGTIVEVPNLKLMQLDEAIVQLDSLGLAYEVIDSTHYVSQVPEGSIIESFPKEYSTVKLGRKILLSTNPSQLPKYPLPNYKDQLMSYVSAKFKTKGFLIDTIIAVPDLSHDLVLKVIDENDSLAEEQKLYKTGSRFTLYVSGGLDGGNVFLPNLVGMTFSESLEALNSLSLNAGGIICEGTLEDTLEAFVLKTFPEFEIDREVKAGSVVDLWLVPDSTFLIID
ncbi:MAG: hypothetical protein CMP53_07760 [Flavobacteriales bacterium]|nr:hypothetical protein [Flavobacteriales bacterium]|tara:strand:+ start:182 stop:973 length:792 start_codon:yes stop_codon:yes gene_type:complete